MAHWQFREIRPDEVETEITQRDQFRNDEVDLNDTVVREAVQNSLDAQSGDKQVLVRFDMIVVPDREGHGSLSDLFREQFRHAEQAGLNVAGLEQEQQRALTVEDFGTRGLTGPVDRKSEDNFSDFWRRHGRSHKSGKSGGRWGLGKIVYSYSSRAGAFFGVTVRNGDSGPYLMGQAVLNTHVLDGIRYAPHGFFSDVKLEPPDAGLQVPISDPAATEEFIAKFGLKRGLQAGLSIVIPWPVDDIDLSRMVEIGIDNYFFPILTDQLVLEFGEKRLERSSLRQVAMSYARAGGDRARIFDFVEAAHQLPRTEMLILESTWYDDGRLSESDFGGELLETLRHRYREGALIGLTLNVELRRKNGSSEKTAFDLFLKPDPDLEQGHDLYVRGGITVPGETKFRHRKALGALVAREEAICEFLGDAENAAHTKWNGRAEKLTAKYKYGPQTLSAIRNSLVQLYDILAQVVDDEDENALLEFFSVPGTSAPRRTKSRGKVSPDPVLPPMPKVVRPVAVRTRRGGFSIVPTPAAAEVSFPLRCRAEVAYDVPSGNAFKRYEKYDFELGKPKGFPVTGVNVRLAGLTGNTFEAILESREFLLEATGFDPERDLLVRINVESE